MRLADAGSDEQANLDASGDAPRFLAFESQRGEELSEGLAQAQAVKELQRHAPGILRVDGFSQQLQHAPAEHRPPHRRRGQLRAGAGQHAAGGHGPRRREERFEGGDAHGRAQPFAEGRAQQAGVGGLGGAAAGKRKIRLLRLAQEVLAARPGGFEELRAFSLERGIDSPGESARMLGQIGEETHQRRFEQQAQRIVRRF